MIAVVHPFGNANVRALLATLQEHDRLAKYFTTVGWQRGGLLDGLFGRRGYDFPPEKIAAHPLREVVRLVASKAGFTSLTKHERGWASIDAVWQELDRVAAARLPDGISAAYAYEDCAEQIFLRARERNVRRVYELPIAYWETAQRLLREEAERYPQWEPTLGGTRDSDEKLARKTRELELAELVICPSNFVVDSLPEHARADKQVAVAPFGSPELPASERPVTTIRRPLRVLFVGSMTQRKGLADLFAAMKLVNSKHIELVVMGSPIQPLPWYRQQLPAFIYEPPRRHAAVLQLMRSCDVFVLPSIVEGRALVQQEAMACGLPLIATRNAGGDDLIREGETGFLVPIRSPEALAEKISWCDAHRERISGMGIAAQKRAAEYTWRGYGETVLAAIDALIAT